MIDQVVTSIGWQSVNDRETVIRKENIIESIPKLRKIQTQIADEYKGTIFPNDETKVYKIRLIGHPEYDPSVSETGSVHCQCCPSSGLWSTSCIQADSRVVGHM